MNKKASFALRIVLGGYLAWLGIRILLEINETKPSNTVFMGIMAVIFIIIGGGYAIFSIRQVLKIRKEEMGIDEKTAENEMEDSYTSRSTSEIKPVELKVDIQKESVTQALEDEKENGNEDLPDKNNIDDSEHDSDTGLQNKDNVKKNDETVNLMMESDKSEQNDPDDANENEDRNEQHLQIEIQSDQTPHKHSVMNDEKTDLAIEIVDNDTVDEEIEKDYEEK